MRTIYVYTKEELASAVYDASKYSIITEIIFGTSSFSVTIDGKKITNKIASKLEKRIKKSSTKIWRNL